MNLLEKRYFILISLTFFVFLVASLIGSIVISLLLFLPLSLLLWLFLRGRFWENRSKRILCILLAGAALFGMLCGGAEQYKVVKLGNTYSGRHTVEGYVLEDLASYDYMGQCAVRIERIDGRNVRFNALLVTDFASELERSESFECETVIVPFIEYEDHAFLRASSEYEYPLICRVESAEDMTYKEGDWRVQSMLSDLNAKLSAKLISTLGRENGSLASALLLGNRGLLADATLRDFKRAGVYHMLALSGMHVAILIGLLDAVLKRARASRILRASLLCFFSLFYIALTGFQLSACRAMLMLFVLQLSLILRARSDALTSLFASVSAICIISPASVLDIGLLLSFLSTLGVICSSIIKRKLFAKKAKSKKDGFWLAILGYIKGAALLLIDSLCVFILTLPVIMIYFGEVSLATFLSNLFMGAVCEIFMVLSIAVMLCPMGFFLISLLTRLTVTVGAFIGMIVNAISHIEGVMLSLRYPGTEVLVWGLFIAFTVLLAIKLERKILVLAPPAVFCVIFCINALLFGFSREGSVRAIFRYGDSLVLSDAKGVYLCDASSRAYTQLYEGALIAGEECHTEIDGVILTHYHKRHAVALQSLANRFMVRAVYLPKPQNGDEGEILSAIALTLEKTGVPIYIFESNVPLSILGGELILSDRAFEQGRVQPRVAVSYAYGDSRITLLEGACFGTSLDEGGMLESCALQSDHLIIGSDGRKPDEEFELFRRLEKGTRVYFADRELFLASDFEAYMHEFEIYVDTFYKKYDLK